MDTITKQRAIAVTKLGELQKIKPKHYTAMELHPKRAMFGRVQRKEHMRFQERVKERKLKLKKDISDIDKYLASVSTYDDYLTTLPGNNGNDVTSITLPSKISLPTAPVILPSPVIVFGKKPMMRETRLRRYKKRGRF